MMTEKDAGSWAALPLGDRTAKHLAKDGLGYLPLIFLAILCTASLLSLLFLSPLPASQLNCRQFANPAYMNCDPPQSEQPTEISYRDRGRAYLRKGEYERAINDFDEALRRDPADAESLLNRAEASFNLGKIDQANADYEAVIKLGSLVAEAYFGRGSMYVEREEFARGIIDLTHAIDHAPNEALYLIWRAYAYLGLGSYDSALSDAGVALRSDPNNVDVWWIKAKAHYYRGQFEEAMTSYNQGILVLGNRTGYPQLWHGRALTALKLSADTALADMKLASERAREDASWQVTICTDLADSGFAEDALFYCDRAVALASADGEFSGVRASAYLRLSRWADALSDLDHAVANSPTSAHLLFLRAYAQERLGHSEEARVDYATARRLDGGIDQVMREAGVVPGEAALRPMSPTLLP